ncbi:type II toxin-antitoxin system VapC family toxin [Halanaerobium sp. MA284_MarDTE_T2]|uniref:type II toxin-antitoxin system VapC family toxin n=1 Tax=Halanaerobium sp. MA284_MarDTE_T2 TaxID=2183913 RepID=UPI000E1288D0|nr:PIN domain-containing protein [Halanaerobium sp. MA284_MarDTE_T2]RCW47718.1 putative nucleic acid-binding protein [Halanaerobium sp. MA284_MarDTE_T2]
MKSTLIDAGPLIALFDKDDKYHEKIKEFLKEYHGRLYTSWPVITEVLHMLDFNVEVQIDFLKWIRKGALNAVSLTKESITRIINLSRKYLDVPMDFSDATLIVISETKNIKEIISIDADLYNFFIYIYIEMLEMNICKMCSNINKNLRLFRGLYRYNKYPDTSEFQVMLHGIAN